MLCLNTGFNLTLLTEQAVTVVNSGHGRKPDPCSFSSGEEHLVPLCERGGELTKEEQL